MIGAAPTARALISAMAQGQRAALGRFYDRHIQLVFNLVARMVGDRAVAERVVEEIFVSAWRNASRYDPTRGTPEVWLINLARARAIDALRALRHRGSSGPVSGPDPPQLERRADPVPRREVGASMGDLSPGQREVLELAYYGGLTQSEIAARTGLALGTVKARIRTGLERLRSAPRGPRWATP
jgi:RNA polymerase sigma-70 factor (ECF subfamily)